MLVAATHELIPNAGDNVTKPEKETDQISALKKPSSEQQSSSKQSPKHSPKQSRKHLSKQPSVKPVEETVEKTVLETMKKAELKTTTVEPEEETAEERAKEQPPTKQSSGQHSVELASVDCGGRHPTQQAGRRDSAPQRDRRRDPAPYQEPTDTGSTPRTPSLRPEHGVCTQNTESTLRSKTTPKILRPGAYAREPATRSKERNK